MHLLKAHYQSVIDELGIFDKLVRFEPMVVGTPPLGIDIESSDIDIACSCCDLRTFELEVTRQFGLLDDFTVKHIVAAGEPAVCLQFKYRGWIVELFCQSLPLDRICGVRHFLVEKRILELRPELLEYIRELKLSGLKTEPAFANALALDGDPFAAVLQLESCSDKELSTLAAAASTRSPLARRRGAIL